MGATVRAPRHVIEDACQFAWSQLIRHRARVTREGAYGWLLSTAMHEAFRLLRVREHEVSLEAELERGGDQLLARQLGGFVADPSSDDFVHRQERVAVLRELPVRQQRMLWLRALGLSAVEVAAHEDCTLRTVDRQLSRARRQLRGQAEAA